MTVLSGHVPLGADEGAAADLAMVGAVEWEAAGRVPDHVLDLLRPSGVLGAMVPVEHGGTEWSLLQYAEICRQLAQTSISAQALLTTHGMVCQALHRWRNDDLSPVLVELATGGALGAFALTDRTAGSDVRSLATSAVQMPDGGWQLDGIKRWVTFGQLADVFLVFARAPQGDVCLVVRKDDPGVRIEAETETSGLRAARLGRLHLESARIPTGRLVGRPGFAVIHIGVRALALGRLCVSAGALGLAERAFDELVAHAGRREQFGAPLLDLPVVRATVGKLAVRLENARMAVGSAARQSDAHTPAADSAVLVAKLTATSTCLDVTQACARLHGAHGVVVGSAVDRWVADARVLEIIEGGPELLTDLLATQALADWRTRKASK